MYTGTIETFRAVFSIKPGDFQTTASLTGHYELMGANGAGKASKMGGPKPRGASVSGGQGEPFWANFGANLNQQSKNLGDGVNRWWTNVSTQSKTWKPPKWEMPGTNCKAQKTHLIPRGRRRAYTCAICRGI